MANINEEITKDGDLELKLDENDEPIIVEQEPETEVEETEVDETTDAEVDEVDETPDWAKENAEVEDSDSVPLGTHTHQRKKYQGQVLERDEEITRLRAQLESKNSPAQTQSDGTPLKRPRNRDFETDDDYDDAIEKYEAQKDERNFQRATQTNTQTNQQEQLQRDIGTSVDNHNIRKEEFLKQYKVDRTVYDKADTNLRKAVDAVRPQYGDVIVDEMIHRLKKGSEKVIPYIGNNKERLAETISSMVNDPSGSDTLVLLGRYQAEVKTPKKLTSQARKPAAHVTGGVGKSLKGKAAKKLFDAAKTPQEACNIRRSAKARGEDVTDWG